MKKLTIYSIVLATTSLTACSSINSIRNPAVKHADGLTYFMPKKDIKVTVSIKGGVRTVSVGTSEPYPDLSEQYVIKYSRNLFGKNELQVGVNTQGLLQGNAKSKTTSQVSDIFKAVGTSVGTVGPMKAPSGDTVCKADGEYVFMMHAADGDFVACEFSVNIKRYGISVGSEKKVVGNSKIDRDSNSGIFYRRSEPYLVTVSPSSKAISVLLNDKLQSIQFSPSESVTHFLPTARTFFSNNEATFVLDAGVLTDYKQDADGELLGLVKLPSEVISAYFTAVGAMFANFKTRDASEAEAISASIKLELAKKKADACVAAIRLGDDKMVAALECGK